MDLLGQTDDRKSASASARSDINTINSQERYRYGCFVKVFELRTTSWRMH